MLLFNTKTKNIDLRPLIKNYSHIIKLIHESTGISTDTSLRLYISSCQNGHLEVAEWLWGLITDIDMNTYDKIAFRWSCENGRL